MPYFFLENMYVQTRKNSRLVPKSHFRFRLKVCSCTAIWLLIQHSNQKMENILCGQPQMTMMVVVLQMYMNVNVILRQYQGFSYEHILHTLYIQHRGETCKTSPRHSAVHTYSKWTATLAASILNPLTLLERSLLFFWRLGQIPLENWLQYTNTLSI